MIHLRELGILGDSPLSNRPSIAYIQSVRIVFAMEICARSLNLLSLSGTDNLVIIGRVPTITNGKIKRKDI